MKRHYIAFTTPETAEIVTDSAPTPASNEVLIKVSCAGVNRADVLQRLGLYPPPEEPRPYPGSKSLAKWLPQARDASISVRATASAP